MEMPLTLGQVAIVDECDYERLKLWKWTAYWSKNPKTFYAKREEKNRTIIMHRFILDAPKGILVDHINHNGLDNRRCNLRFATASQNAHNHDRKPSGAAGLRGVCLFTRSVLAGRRRKWVASIRVEGKRKYLGIFESPEIAHEAYRAAELKYFGEFSS